MLLAFIFGDVGVGEWLVLLAVVLVVVGPRRLPETARKFGRYYSKFRRAADGFKRQLLEMDSEIENAVTEADRQAAAAFRIDGDESTVLPDEAGGQAPSERGEQIPDADHPQS